MDPEPEPTTTAPVRWELVPHGWLDVGVTNSMTGDLSLSLWTLEDR